MSRSGSAPSREAQQDHREPGEEPVQIRTDVPALVRVINQLTAENHELRALLDAPAANVKALRPNRTDRGCLPRSNRGLAAVQRRPVLLGSVAALVMLVLAAPLLGMRLGASDQGNNAAASTVRKAYNSWPCLSAGLVRSTKWQSHGLLTHPPHGHAPSSAPPAHTAAGAPRSGPRRTHRRRR